MLKVMTGHRRGCSRRTSCVTRTVVTRVSALAAAVVVASSASEGAASFDSIAAAHCPAASAVRPGDFDTAVRSARRLIPGTFHAATPGNEWTRYPRVLGAVQLLPGAEEIPGAVALRHRAAAHCSAAVANASWAVIVDFPGSKVAGEPAKVTYVVRTRFGWRLWLVTNV